jgi:hypothetical protein
VGAGANGKPVPDTFLFALQGRATLTKALASAIERARCKGRETNGRGHLRGCTLRPEHGAAPADGGDRTRWHRRHRPRPLRWRRHADRRHAEPGPTTISSDGDSYLHYVLPAGTQTPLACIFGQDCTPASGGFALPRQLALSYGGRTTVVAGIAVTYTLPSVHRLIPTITGTLDGAPVTGSVRHIDLHFTATGPVT